MATMARRPRDLVVGVSAILRPERLFGPLASIMAVSSRFQSVAAAFAAVPFPMVSRRKPSAYWMSWSLAAIVVCIAGGLTLLVIGIGFLWLYILRCNWISKKTSESGSSDPSTQVEWNRAGQIPSTGCVATLSEHRRARRFSLEELLQATKNFDESKLVGVGSFGLVYKGLLLDGTVVAIKRRQQASKLEFVEEVNTLSAIYHRNLVTLIGYCQEGGLQMLVYEYLPNRSISSHLCGEDKTTKIEFKQRLLIAIGAAKGLSQLHSLSPPLIHRNFKTSNVLVDENFIAKVADAGIVKLLERIENDRPPQASVRNIFQDPHFGVFLLELIAGREVHKLLSEAPSESLTKLVEAHLMSESLIDGRLGSSYTYGGMKELIVLTLRCLGSPGRRPKMEHVARELDRILETEMKLTTVMTDGSTPIVIPGSQLFTL